MNNNFLLYDCINLLNKCKDCLRENFDKDDKKNNKNINNIINEINFFLNNHCEHEVIDDIVDIDPDHNKYLKVKYCNKCLINL